MGCLAKQLKAGISIPASSIYDSHETIPMLIFTKNVNSYFLP